MYFLVLAINILPITIHYVNCQTTIHKFYFIRQVPSFENNNIILASFAISFVQYKYYVQSIFQCIVNGRTSRPAYQSWCCRQSQSLFKIFPYDNFRIYLVTNQSFIYENETCYKLVSNILRW